MTKLCEWADRLGALLRGWLLAIVGSEGLFFGVMLLFYGVFNTDVFLAKRSMLDPLRDYVVMPWAGAMMGMYLMKERRRAAWISGRLRF